MGAKTWMIVYSEGNVEETLKAHPEIDRAKTKEFVQKLFPKYNIPSLEDGDLSYTCPPGNEIYAGYFSGVFIVAAREFGIDYPSKLPQRFLDSSYGSNVQFHAMHSVVDWFAFAVWKNGELERALSLSPDSGVLEDIGQKLPFELPYWKGEHPAIDPEEDDVNYPFKFHPLELGEAALGFLYGYQLEGGFDPSKFRPENIPLMGFKKSKPWWKLW